MEDIKILFHKLGSLHHSISIGAGVTRELLKALDPKKLSSKKWKEEISGIIDNLIRIEKSALKANRMINRLRKIVAKD